MRTWIWGGLGAIVLVVLLYWGFFRTAPVVVVPDGPAVAAAKVVVAKVEDNSQAGTIIDGGVAQSIPCGVAARNAFDPNTGVNRNWFYQWPDGTLECYKTAGFHRMTGVKLVELKLDQVKVILGDVTKYPAVPELWSPPARIVPAPPAPAAVPAIEATPLPLMGEGPCTATACGVSQ